MSIPKKLKRLPTRYAHDIYKIHLCTSFYSKQIVFLIRFFFFMLSLITLCATFLHVGIQISYIDDKKSSH